MTQNDDVPVGSFRITFGVKENQIGTEAYAYALLALTEAINEGANKIESGARFELRVNTEKDGSFESEIYMLAAGLIGTTYPLATYENFKAVKDFAKSAFGVVSGVMNLGKWLKGKAAKEILIEGDHAIVINGDNNRVTVNRNVIETYNDQRVQIPLRQMYEALDEDRTVSSLQVEYDGVEPVYIDRADFKQLKSSEGLAEAKTRKRTVKANLYVVRQSFEPKRKSDFIYAGNTISAHIDSERFWEGIDGGERFAKGDRLVTRLEITEVFNETIQTYERKSYRIVDVLEHQPRPRNHALLSSN